MNDTYATHGLWTDALFLIIEYGAGALSLDYGNCSRYEAANLNGDVSAFAENERCARGSGTIRFRERQSP